MDWRILSRLDKIDSPFLSSLSSREGPYGISLSVTWWGLYAFFHSGNLIFESSWACFSCPIQGNYLTAIIPSLWLLPSFCDFLL